MLGVASERDGFVTRATGVPKHVDQAVIVACGNKGLVFGEVNGVDVGAVCACREDPFDKPAELGTFIGPLSALSV